MYNTIEECKASPKLRCVKDLFFNTKIHGGFVEYEADKDFLDSGVYLVASVGPISDIDFEKNSPVAIADKTENSGPNFYPYEFAVKVTNEDPLIVFDKVSEFCRRAELVNTYFTLENCKVPKQISIADINTLNLFATDSHNTRISAAARENACNMAKEMVRDFYKDEKFAGFTGKLVSKFKNKDQEILEFTRKYSKTCGIGMLEVDEKQLNEYLNTLERQYPNLEYVVSDKITFDSGLPEIEKGEYDPYGSLPRKLEYREIYFKKTQEEEFQNTLNYLHLIRGCDLPSMSELSDQGPVCSVKIPYNYMRAFNATCKKNGVEYTVDRGVLDKASVNTVPVVYLEKDKDMVDAITDKLCEHFAKESMVHAYEKSLYTEKVSKQQRKNRGFAL